MLVPCSECLVFPLSPQPHPPPSWKSTEIWWFLHWIPIRAVGAASLQAHHFLPGELTLASHLGRDGVLPNHFGAMENSRCFSLTLSGLGTTYCYLCSVTVAPWWRGGFPHESHHLPRTYLGLRHKLSILGSLEFKGDLVSFTSETCPADGQHAGPLRPTLRSFSSSQRLYSYLR